jgi:hypothetical protein
MIKNPKNHFNKIWAAADIAACTATFRFFLHAVISSNPESTGLEKSSG